MKTYMANPDKIERKWYVVDAADCTLGRLASEVAKVLRGKNKPLRQNNGNQRNNLCLYQQRINGVRFVCLSNTHAITFHRLR